MNPSPEEILRFWFGECRERDDLLPARVEMWFGRSDELDREIARRWSDLPDLAASGDLDAWRSDLETLTALVLVLDQFPRNLFRGSGRAFAYDAQALDVTLDALSRSVDSQLTPIEACFLYLPLEHAEDLALQIRCVSLFEALELRCSASLRPTFENFAAYAERHRSVIERFGRFPHRNAVLGRESTPEEATYLETGGETFS